MLRRCKVMIAMAIALETLIACQGGKVEQTGLKQVPAQPETRPGNLNKREEHVLSFVNYDRSGGDAAEAVYVLDGRELGTGDAGLNRLLREMESWPTGSMLIGRWERAGIAFGGPPRWVPPYHSRYGELYEVIDRKGFTFRFPPDELGRNQYPLKPRAAHPK